MQVKVNEELIGEELAVLDMEGRILLREIISTTNCQMPTANFQNGIYFLKLKNEARKFIKLD